MTTTPTPEATLGVTPNRGAQKFLEYAKAHVAVLGAIVGVLLQFFAGTDVVREYGTLIVGILTALGVYVVPNEPSTGQKIINAQALAAQAQIVPESSVDVSAPVAPAGLQDVQKS